MEWTQDHVKNIIFDFDGVILDSVPIKTEAFRTLFESFPEEEVDQLIAYHLKNGGVSRYEKIHYFFEKIHSQLITDSEVLMYAQQYSKLTKEELCNSKYLIADSLCFIQTNYKKINMHIASGADESDLKEICRAQGLDKYFLSIHGAPEKKDKIVRSILEVNNYHIEKTILIGDSINDYHAAKTNKLQFFGYNNIELHNKEFYIDSFSKIIWVH